MSEPVEDSINWNSLLRRIKKGQCTPFLGAGACASVLPVGGKIANDWAEKHHYPLSDPGDLIRVAQYRAVIEQDSVVPKEEIIEELKKLRPPDFSDVNQVHRILADLPLPVYLTTNYDDFMARALRSRANDPKDPQEVICRWNSLLKQQPTVFDSDYSPSPQKPVVFHLHGHWSDPKSLVLTEDDYLDFLRESADPALLPPRIREALTGTSLLFLGYAISDWTFRVLLRALVGSLERSVQQLHLSVQLEPGKPDDPQWPQERRKAAAEYLTQYFGRFGNMTIQVYWGSCESFVAKLRERWEASNAG